MEHLCRTMASALAKEFDFSSKTASAPPLASNNDTVDPEIQIKSPSNDISSVQAGPSDDTPQQYGRQSASQENAGISSLHPNNATHPQGPIPAGDTILQMFFQSLIAQRERNKTGSISQNSIKARTKSVDNDNGSDRTDDGSSGNAGDNDKDNTKAPGIAPPKQERPGSIGNSAETMSKRMAMVAAKARQGDTDSQYKLAEAYRMGTDGLSRSDKSAIDWYIKAGNQGHANAQTTMGMYYREGFSVPKNYFKAMEWNLKAAN